MEPRGGRIQSEMEGVELGDPRRNRRAELVLERLMKHPGLSLPKAFPEDAELEGTYRLLGNEDVGPQALLAPHLRRTVERAAGCTGQLLVAIHDTSEMSFGGEYFREGMGILPNGGQGFMAHVCLLAAYDGELKDPLGVVNVEALFRDEPKKAKRSGYAISQGDDSEGLRWGRAIEAVEEVMGTGNVVNVCDREADAYLLQAQMQAAEASYVIRSKHDRRTADDGIKLWDASRAQEEIRMRRTVHMKARHSGELKQQSTSGARALKGSQHRRTPAGKKAHPPRFEREAELHVTASQHLLRKPDVEGRPCAENLPVNVVRVYEPNPPTGMHPVEWLLLTNLPIDRVKDIERVVDAYRARWLIEELFRALKTGCSFEKLQLEGRRSLHNALALYVSVAWKLLRLRALARLERETPAVAILTPLQLLLLSRLVPKAKLSQKATARDALLAVAALGGHIKNNGDPGWQVIGRGFDDLLHAEVGFRLATAAP